MITEEILLSSILSTVIIRSFTIIDGCSPSFGILPILSRISPAIVSLSVSMFLREVPVRSSTSSKGREPSAVNLLAESSFISSFSFQTRCIFLPSSISCSLSLFIFFFVMEIPLHRLGLGRRAARFTALRRGCSRHHAGLSFLFGVPASLCSHIPA